MAFQAKSIFQAKDEALQRKEVDTSAMDKLVLLRKELDKMTVAP